MTEKRQTFALDIGTRTVVGILAEHDKDKAFVKKIIRKEHEERAMLDGQIHDIQQVAKVIQDVKAEMENLYGPINKVCVAAAGRTLKTAQAKISQAINGRKINKEDVTYLELMAVQQAEEQMAKEFKGMETEYFCVGYSVLYYYLDGEKIGNLIDQTGDTAAVEIIATFLPKIVIDSLMTALQKCDLTIEALTLEPIAAIQLLIPQSMRRLNVALVDIGAGTSDIAITNNDTIVNYGMVPVAGDEITEAISDQFLLDFPDAEKAKLELTNSDSITVKDILGFENIVQKDEVIAAISTAIDRLATLIADEIMRLNGLKPPQAVMLIGGGSLTPEIPKKISEKLNLPVNRVAIRGIDAVGQVLFAEEVTNQPELITPVGIAVSAHQHSIQYKNVFVNDRPLRLLELNDLTVGDCLVQSGIRMSQLYGKPGLAKIITVNDQLLTLKGQMGSSPILKKNGVPCTLDDPVCEGDRIIAIKGTDGKEAVHTIKDIIGEQSIPFILNQKPYTYRPNIFVNGQLTNFDYMIQDKDQIHIEECTIANAIRSISDQTVNIEPFKVWINDQEVHLPDYSGKILKNGRNTHLHDIIQPNDQIEVKFTEQPTVEQLATQQNWQLTIEIPVFFNGKEVRVSKTITKVIRNEKELTKHDEIFNGDRLFIKKMTNIQFVFQDVFRFVDFHFPKNAIQYKILLNGQNAALHTPIHAGDQLEIIWVEEGL